MSTTLTRRVIAAGIATIAIVGGTVATAPSASATSRGTATASESRRVLRNAEDQRCLTLAEARRMVHGNGTYTGVDDIGARYYHWSGRGSVRSLDISVLGSCTDLVVIDWKRGADTTWGHYARWQAYAA